MMRPALHVRAGGGFLGSRRRAAALCAVAACAGALVVDASAAPKQAIVAEAAGRAVAIYRSPSAKRPYAVLSNPNRLGSRLTFLVKQRRPGWEQVYLPVRPNGSTGWIRDEQVTLAVNPYRVVVSLSRHTLSLYRGGRLVHREAAGVGRSVTSTPTGMYFVVDLLEQTNPHGAYGPFAFGLSAYSNVLYRFGGGPGQIGLHGTNEPGALGTDVSHGCIRISNAGVTKLAHVLPLGTPVEIRR